MMRTAASESPLLELDGVTKRFGAVLALDRVSLDLRRGEIHALLGENGAGKSTLIKILAGVHAADGGAIHVEGRAVAIRGVADAHQLGVRVIHQELSLAPNLSIAENIYLGREPTRSGLLSRRRMVQDAQALVAALGLHEIADVRAPVARLSLARRQLVEIARALSCQARVLVLDEPTSALSAPEADALGATLRRLRSQGVGIIYISHRLDEVLGLADRVTVLRNGLAVGTQQAAGAERRQLVRWMVGREASEHFHRPAYRPGQPVLEVEGLCGARLRGVTLRLHAGEVLGLAGLAGSGRSALARAIVGAEPVTGGTIRVAGRPVTITGPRSALDAGIALVPEDRQREGLVMTQTVGFNLALPWLRLWIPRLFPRWELRRAIVGRAIRGFRIRAADPEQRVRELSGGNQQKILMARWMEQRPRVLIADEPTRGIDVGAREEIFHLLGDLVESGMAVLLISSDFNELVSVSHRVALYRAGRVLDILPAQGLTQESLMERLMASTSEDGDTRKPCG